MILSSCLYSSYLSFSSFITYAIQLAESYNGAPNIISGIITGLTIILSPILIPIVFPKYIEAIEVIQVMGFALVPSVLTLILTSELLGKENSKSVILGVIVAIIVLIIGIIILGEYMGLLGLAYSLVIARSLQCITLLILKKIG